MPGFCMRRLRREEVKHITVAEVLRGYTKNPEALYPRYVCLQCGHQTVSWGVAKRHRDTVTHITKEER